MRVSALNPGKPSGKILSILPDLARRSVFAVLRNIEHGVLVLEENGQQYVFGNRNSEPHLSAKLVIRDPVTYGMILKNGDLGAGEAYIQGYWDTDCLVDLVRLFVLNMHALQKLNGQQGYLRRLAGSFFHWLRRNHLGQSRQNIAAHYDLSNDFFSLFLDPSMAYSSAIFSGTNQSLEQASEQKFRHVCERLQLSDSDHLLEIGTGWGGLAVYAAKHYGCRVTTTTLSKEQFDYAKAWIVREGLQDRITLLLKDYRELEGRFDKLVSIEMIEAVGSQYYSTYFSVCNALLKPDGLMLIQAITISDQRYQQSLKEIDFIKRYIFPGGQLPCNSIITHHVASDTDMQLIGLEDITLDYAETLRHWRLRFNRNLDSVRSQGGDSRFIRMWEFYLCFCEGGFRERVIHTAQFLLAKPGFRKPGRIGFEG